MILTRGLGFGGGLVVFGFGAIVAGATAPSELEPDVWRMYYVMAEDRTWAIAPEGSKTATVAAENRTLVIPAENRTFPPIGDQ